MPQTSRNISLGFSSEVVQEGLHMCYIYNDDKERNRTMAQYLSAGLQGGEKVLYLVDVMSPSEFTDSMGQLGLDIPKYGGQFSLSEALPTYCPDGLFSVDLMLNVVGTFYQEARKEGYVGARGSGEMSWALRDGVVLKDELVEYETRLTEVLEQFPMTACCQYDARIFDGATIMNMLTVHPVVIVRGQLVKNPFYLSPDVFLKEYKARLATS